MFISVPLSSFQVFVFRIVLLSIPIGAVKTSAIIAGLLGEKTRARHSAFPCYLDTKWFNCSISSSLMCSTFSTSASAHLGWCVLHFFGIWIIWWGCSYCFIKNHCIVVTWSSMIVSKVYGSCRNRSCPWRNRYNWKMFWYSDSLIWGETLRNEGTLGIHPLYSSIIIFIFQTRFYSLLNITQTLHLLANKFTKLLYKVWVC